MPFWRPKSARLILARVLPEEYCENDCFAKKIRQKTTITVMVFDRVFIMLGIIKRLE